jgi:putative protease
MRRPEILAPAGDRDALAAALAAGADAVYLGLDDGFNARARADNFPSTGLAEIVRWVHRAGARLYVTLNTLVFEPELATVEELIRRVAAAGVDAIIVQDPAVALLARRICPVLEVHASTQMTASSPLAVSLLEALGLSRVVVPRELSIDEIRAYRAGTPVELEVFVHGALCVAWSGQCLSSEAWGGRSANRGQCAQACRLPYALVVDGEVVDLGEVEYLLSPKDLVGLDAIPALADIGVASLKIEGRLKGPAYVAATVAQYRAAVDPFRAPGTPAFAPAVAIPGDRDALEIAYSRGVSSGFLAGADHQTLVEGRFPRHRGRALGRVTLLDRTKGELEVVPDPAQRPVTGGVAQRPITGAAAETAAASTTSAAPPAASSFEVIAGMGVVFDAGTPEQAEQGGPIFAAAKTPTGYRLRFGDPGPDLDQVHVGDFVWISSDPRVTSAGLRATEAGRGTLGRIPVDLVVSGAAGQPLSVRASAGIVRQPAERDPADRDPADRDPADRDPAERDPAERDPAERDPAERDPAERDPAERAARPFSATATSASLLAPARGVGITRDLIADKLGSFGGTPFYLGELDVSALPSGLHLPVSELKEVRRALVAELDLQLDRVDRPVASESVIEAVRTDAFTRIAAAPASSPIVVPLCRNDAQLDAVLDAGAREVELDWMELVGLQRAVTRARARGAKVGVATVRVQKPGEDKIDAHLARLEPDSVLVRSWGSLAYFAHAASAHHSVAHAASAHPSVVHAATSEPHPGGISRSTAPILHGDFSLNVTNSITATWVLQHGLATLTAAHDLDRDQLFALLAAAPRGRIAVTVHHHIPTFHTEHCVYAHLLSHGRDYRTCGRPCETHQIALRDRVGLVHPVNVDVGCRNTVFNAQAQSAASLVPDLLTAGVTRLRIELVRESAAETARVYDAYVRLAAGQLSASDAVRTAAVHEQFGVTRGTMRTLTVLR